MKRSTLIHLHLYFTGVSLFLLLLFITSGSLHLFEIEEGESKKVLDRIEIQGLTTKEGLEKFFLATFG